MADKYDCVIIGGGIAGLQAAIQLGRYKRSVLVIDSNDGRSNLCKNYQNILGWPEGISGQTLREMGRQQATSYGIQFTEDRVIQCQKEIEGFNVITKSANYEAATLLFATGVVDRIPSELQQELHHCMGKTVYVCPDCDGYEVNNRRVLVLGSGKTGASLSLTLTYWTNDITYINHDKKEIGSLADTLMQKGITYKEGAIKKVITEAEMLKGVILENNEFIYGERGFLAFGGNKVRTELAHELGVELLENQHIIVNPRTKETNVSSVWAAGDIVAHSEQVTVAMGEGLQAAIWIHKRLLELYEK
ncbi:NAD(P)/FAD-dependent oxidoreductase [Priestia megaterium]|uniref:NAD(P)/FAD-dependent oxidoreductase n=1 Tax=Priestia aryabhattai TaxID=412384 RepID=A0ABD5KRZ6_PRIAR|nr:MULTISPECIES: NAD(P)/FAD-dependent oxidoreductase [Priestia]MBK0293704.1 NAD(P)/FAD-dependent oxidoreductase [Bacillus sp. S34]UPK52339.1 NAD(P)/FAD-dependent oxidoreductase [Bacillus sp. H8-1]AWD67612.1 NAD(P)/FAD-dependent oxidoreductase [Priestia megaterium]MDC7764677.1 NAD(P)/FAD-dependent oxidoreductase [Priestia aryabhattai]MEB4887005.1 NAD(P)/FAD-dependent oxidoreductase [Priestia megaterium]